MQSAPSNFAEEYKCQKGGCCLMKNSNLQSKDKVKKIFRRYIHTRDGRILYPKGRCFVLTVEA